MELLSGFDKRGVQLGLLTKSADIEDVEYLSTYFVLQEFSPKFTAGKNSITFNGSAFLKKGSEILVECLDSSGQPLYIESTTKSNVFYKESSAYILSIHVYSETFNGPGKLVLYGTLNTGESVRWIGNILIDKTQQNVSTVRFYTKPTLEVIPLLSPVIASVGDLNKLVEFTGSFYSHAVKPEKNSLKINKTNIDVDYRIYSTKFPLWMTDPTGSFNNQMENFKIDVMVKTIQEPYSYKNVNVDFTSSVKIKKVINSTTIILDDVISYKDSKKNDVIVNVVAGDFYIKYPYISYNTASESSSFLTSNTKNDVSFIKQSYADVVYRNIKTFSGFISRHKLYRKSLFSPGDFEVIADEPLEPYELLQDKLTTNKSFDNMGTFYNQHHVDKYWFPSGGKIELTQSSNRLLNGVDISLSNTTPALSCFDLNSVSNYIILKNNFSYLERNSTYYPYNTDEFLSTSGSSYDSNFIDLKKNVSYVISLNAILKKDPTTLRDSSAGLELYFTSSVYDVNLEQNSVKEQPGLLKIGFISAFEPIAEKVYNPVDILFTVNHDLYGSIVVVPRKCTATISDLSLKPYGDVGFSPDTLITRIPFPVTVANEGFEIKAELFDINSNLVYSDLRTISTFDVSGSSLNVFIPGLKDPNNTTFLSGSLEISKSLWVGQNVYVTESLSVKGAVFFGGILESTYTNERMLAWHPSTDKVSYTNVNNILPDEITGTEEINLTLYSKNSDVKTLYRLLPSVKGKNIFVPTKTSLPPAAAPKINPFI